MTKHADIPKPDHQRPALGSYYFAAFLAESDDLQTAVLQAGFTNYGRELMEWINSKPNMDLPILCAVLRLTRDALRNADETLASTEDSLVESLDITTIVTKENKP